MNAKKIQGRLRLLLTSLSLFLVVMPLLAMAQVSPPRTRKKPPPSGLNKGVNLGNALEAPFEGAWGLTIQEFYFDRIANAGFDHVRLPISWTYYAAPTSPFLIDETFFERVDELVDQCSARGLKLIINNHHYAEIDADPLGELPRALAIWDQIAERYQDEPDTVFFEVLNEPHGAFNDDPLLWDFVLAESLAVIRQTNPTRKILVGPVWWNSPRALLEFQMPADPNLIATVHYYDPFEFTHQGASWVDPTPPTGVEWTGNKYRLDDLWQNWSWNTELEGTNDGMEVTYTAGWAGMALFRNSLPINGAVGINVVMDADSPMRIRVTDADGATGQVDFQPNGSMRTYVFSMQDFGVTNVQRIDLQNLTPDAQETFTVRAVSVLSPARQREAVVVKERTAIAQTMKRLAQWGRANAIPIYVGEFGAYEEGDMPSRVRWTERVRQSCGGWGLGWGYWEFGAGFGIYDPTTDQFRVDLLRALLPNYNP